MACVFGGVRYEEEFILNLRGFKLFTCRWLPAKQEPKALIFMCHGYAVECSVTMKDTGIRLAEAGYAVYGIDYEGHGKSAGLNAYIPSFDELVDDCSRHFTSICERVENKRKMRFILGESMGGAVALLLHRKQPSYWDGAVLVAPMCKIADDMKPPAVVMSILNVLCNFIPTWKIIPTQDIIDVAIKEPKRREEMRSNPFFYKEKPRLKTGNELMRASTSIEENLHEISLPFLIVHGGNDRVTDQSVSQMLYESASSEDKTFRLYPEMWHTLTSGEPIENIDIVFKDIIDWLDDRSAYGNARLEREQKGSFDTKFSVVHDKIIPSHF